MTRLMVFFRDTLCGELTESRQGQLEFKYLSSWLENENTPISLTLPLTDAVHGHERVATFVANLLPEGGDLRSQLERLLHVDARHDFGLLAAIGRESAGALSFWPEETASDLARPGYAELETDEFHHWREFAYRLPFQFHGRAVRLSLAGIQAKTALYFDAKGAPFVPLNGAATTHIIKPRLPGCQPSTVYTELVTMALARAILGPGEVPEADIWENCYRIRRYDRSNTEGSVIRQHQEDFCLALGRMPERKYETGSPRESLLPQCFNLIDQLGGAGAIRAPVIERQRLLNQVIINVLLHNPDAHLKNYSLLYQDDRSLRVAPLYDCLCTFGLTFSADQTPWERDSGPAAHTRELSLKIGDAVNIEQVGAADWGLFASQCGFTGAFTKRRVRELAGAVIAALPSVTTMIVEANPDAKAATETVAQGVRQQCKDWLSG